MGSAIWRNISVHKDRIWDGESMSKLCGMEVASVQTQAGWEGVHLSISWEREEKDLGFGLGGF